MTKCEQLLVTTPDAGQISGGLTNAQIRNSSIVNSLGYLRSGIVELLPNLDYPPQEAVVVLDESINNIGNFMDVALSLLLSSIMGSLENKMSRMHTENFSLSISEFHGSQEVQACSNYVLEIQDFLETIQSDYLSLYTCRDFLLERLEMVTSRLLQLLVTHVSLIRNLSEGGKLKIAADMTQLEFAVTPFCRRFEDLGHVYKQIRAFRPLLFQSIEDIPSNPNLGDSLPYSTVMHFLFSQAPVQLLSPYTFSGWTIPQYISWLDDHGDENEKILLIKKTMDSYASKVPANALSSTFAYVTFNKLYEQYQQTL